MVSSKTFGECRFDRHLAVFAGFEKGFHAQRICENAGVGGIMAQTPQEF
jgi:hypothetical protein